jgi:hypothetical protein
MTGDDGYRIEVEELAWLIGHVSRLTAARLEMLKSLQSALPREGEGTVAELKETLSQIIIMQTRLTGREESLDDLLEELVRLGTISHVALDESAVTGAAAEIARAAGRIQSKG